MLFRGQATLFRREVFNLPSKARDIAQAEFFSGQQIAPPRYIGSRLQSVVWLGSRAPATVNLGTRPTF